MGRCSNTVSGALSFLILLLSIPILGGGIWLSQRGESDCERFLDKPLIVLGVFLMVVALAGVLGSWCRVTWLLWVYLFVMFLLILLVFVFTIFAFVVTNKGAGKVVSGRGFKEYRLGDYSNWLQNRVEESGNWRKIRSCLQDSKICNSLQENANTKDEFLNKHFSPTQSGCCKPPYECNFDYKNATWVEPKGGFPTDNKDCKTWGSKPEELCYECDSCRAGVLANLKNDWKKVAILNIIFLVFLIIAYSIGCCAFRNNRREANYHKGYP